MNLFREMKCRLLCKVENFDIVSEGYELDFDVGVTQVSKAK
jgi:hypothetical protein